MANLIYTIPIPEGMADNYINIFALSHGYDASQGITTLEYARKTLNKYVEESISRYLAAEQARIAREAAIEQTKLSMGSIATTLSIE